MHLRVVEPPDKSADKRESAVRAESVPSIQQEAWWWALDNRVDGGELPSGREIGQQFGRQERWGRLIKQWGQQGRFEQVPMMTSTVSK